MKCFTAMLLWSAASVAPLTALAQTTPPEAPETAAPNAAAQPADGVQDIIVTAQRREERLQTVPIAITAISGAGLEQAGIRDITRLSVLTPGLTVGQSGSDSRPALRGVNTDNSRSAQADASVAFFVDGIYQSANQQALVGFVDLARVEVQRGPQGTLYGRNSFGGNIVLVSNLPTDKLEGAVRAEGGNFGHYRVEGFVNAPVSDTVDVRLAGLRDKSDGYVQNLSRSGSRAGDVDDYYFRPSLRWRPTSRLEVILRNTDWIGDGSGGGAYEYKVEGILSSPDITTADRTTTVLPINPRANAGDYAAAVRNGQVPPGSNLPELVNFPNGVPVPTDPWTINQDTPSTRTIRSYGGSAEINYDFDFARLKLLGSYTDFDARRTSDGDFTQYQLRSNLQESTNKTGTGEIQLASKPGSPFQWVIGAYYLTTNATEFFQQYRYYNGAFSDNNIGTFGTDSIAGFAQASYNITRELRVTGGVRYTDDYKSSSFLNLADPTGSTGKVGRHFGKATWRGAVDYQVTPDKLVYFSASSGFRAGGFNPGVSSTINPAFTPETVTAYEIGTKTRWLGNTLQVNLSAFINDYKNLQVVGFDGATSLVFTQNVGEKVARGVEAEILIRPVRAFEVAISYAYLDAHWNSGSAIDQISFGSNVNLAGKQAAFSPDNRIGASASYEFALAGGGTLTPRVQTQFSSQFYLLDYNTIIERQKSYSKTDVRLTYTFPNKRFTLEGFATNLENSVVKSGGEFGGRGAFFIGYAPPRMYGGAVGVKF